MVRIICVAFTLLASFVVPASAEWHEVRTENFTVVGDADLDRLEDMAVELEQFRIFLGIIHAGRLMPPEPVNVPVYIMKDEDSFLEIYDNPSAGGVYTNRVETPIFIVNAQNDGSQSFVRGQKRDRKRQSINILKHEYVHHFLYINGPDYYPMWYSEGMADYYSSFEYDNGLAKVGELLSMRAGWLIYDDLLDWEQVFMSKNTWRRGGDSSPLTTIDVSKLYSQSWLATHYLMSDQGRRAQLVDFLRMIQLDTENYEQLFTEAFGADMNALGDDIERYLDRNRFQLLTVDLSAYETDPQTTSRKLDDWEAEMAFLFARRFFARKEETQADVRERLEALIDQRPDRIEPLVELAFLEREANNYELAQEYTDKAYSLAPQDGMVLLLKALTGPFTERATWLKAAREADPDNALAHYEYAFRYQDSPSEEVLDAAISAMYLSAESELLPLLVGKLLIDLEYYEDAIGLLQPISVWARDTSTRRAARYQLDRIPSAE